MILAFDAKRFTHNRTGLGNYSRFLLQALAETFPEHSYLLFSPSEGKPELYSSLLERHPLHLHTPDSRWGRIFPAVWRSSDILRQVQKSGAELYHGLSNELPHGKTTNLPMLLTVHDLIYMRYPDFYKPIDRLLYKKKYGDSARRADRIVAISETTKTDLIDYFDISPNKIDVVYQGCHPAFAIADKVAAEAVKSRYALPDSYILFVGSIEERKNLGLIVEALSLLPLPDIHLVAIGRHTPYTDLVKEKIVKLGLQDRVHLYHDIPFLDLPAIYQAATVFCYPSRFEGFGIPVIEALSSRIPVVAATGSCLEEAGGPDQLYTDPDDPEMLASMLETAISDTAKREEMIIRGQEYIKAFRADRIAQDMMRIYRSLV